MEYQVMSRYVIKTILNYHLDRRKTKDKKKLIHILNKQVKIGDEIYLNLTNTSGYLNLDSGLYEGKVVYNTEYRIEFRKGKDIQQFYITTFVLSKLELKYRQYYGKDN